MGASQCEHPRNSPADLGKGAEVILVGFFDDVLKKGSKSLERKMSEGSGLECVVVNRKNAETRHEESEEDQDLEMKGYKAEVE